jgi:hypothetical protein
LAKRQPNDTGALGQQRMINEINELTDPRTCGLTAVT